MKEQRIFAIIQARMGSSRLPGKVLKELCGRPMLDHIVRRAGQTEGITSLMIATSAQREDDPIAAFAGNAGIPCFRGSEEDVLARYWGAAKALGAENEDVIVRLTADNPLVDPQVLRELLDYFRKCPYAYASTSGYPLGLGAEVFTFQALEEAHRTAKAPHEREHVTPYMYRDPDRVGRLVSPEDISGLRFTVDTPEDFAFVEAVYRELYHGEHDFYLRDILKFLERNPSVRDINRHIRQKKLGE